MPLRLAYFGVTYSIHTAMGYLRFPVYQPAVLEYAGRSSMISHGKSKVKQKSHQHDGQGNIHRRQATIYSNCTFTPIVYGTLHDVVVLHGLLVIVQKVKDSTVMLQSHA